MDIMGKPYPKEFRVDVVRIARQGDTPFAQLATDDHRFWVETTQSWIEL